MYIHPAIFSEDIIMYHPGKRKQVRVKNWTPHFTYNGMEFVLRLFTAFTEAKGGGRIFVVTGKLSLFKKKDQVIFNLQPNPEKYKMIESMMLDLWLEIDSLTYYPHMEGIMNSLDDINDGEISVTFYGSKKIY